MAKPMEKPMPKGPGGKPGPGMRGPKVENPGKIFMRLFKMVMEHYLIHFIIVVVCILIAAYANVRSSLFSETLIDDYIIPLILCKTGAVLEESAFPK